MMELESPMTSENFPTHAESARALVARKKQALLSTIDRQSGHPYGSLSDVLPLDNGDVVLLISNLAGHTKNIDADPKVSLLFNDGAGHDDGLARQRVCLLGRAEDVEPRDMYREKYLEAHPHAATYVGFKDFRFMRVHVERVRYIAGFGRMSWMDNEDYHMALPDPLWASFDGVVGHMNEDHAHNLLDYAQKLLGFPEAEKAVMVGVDRFGIDMVAYRGDETRQLRLPFAEEAKNARFVRKALVELAERAKQAG